MRTICLHDRHRIETFLRRDPQLHLYTLGDLDEFFWPYTTWYALEDDGQIREVVLVYSAMAEPILLALTAELGGAMRSLLHSLLPLLPRRLYVHASGNLASEFADDYHVEPHGLHYKMALADPSALETVDTAVVVPLTTADLPDLLALYRASYPENSFDPRMVQTGHYYGMRVAGRLVSVAGVHVYSEQYRVAALGNVLTHHDYRGQGLGKAVCARLCRALQATVDHIGLNVKADNAYAIAMYTTLGFRQVAAYDECSLALNCLASP